MAMTPNDALRGPCRGDPATIKAWLKAEGAGGGYDAFVDELYRCCADPAVGLDGWLLTAEAAEETNQFQSSYWLNDGNPAGIGIWQSGVASPFSIPGQPRLSAHIQVCVILAHLGIAQPPPIVADALGVAGFKAAFNGSVAFATKDSGFQAALPRGVRTLVDLCVPFHSSITGNAECVHACDPSYAVTICQRGNAMDPKGLHTVSTSSTTTTTTTPPTATPPPPPKAAPPVVVGPPSPKTVQADGTTAVSAVPHYSTNVPGLPGGPLLTDYPIRTAPLIGLDGYQRSGLTAQQPRRSVQHGTANPNSSAESDAQFFLDGAGGGQTSVHAEADDTGVYVLLPANEVAWQAADGGGPGNMNGFATEMSENSGLWADPARVARAIYVTADWMGRCSARLGIAIPEQHWDFNAGDPNRHDCPYQLRHQTVNGVSAWTVYVQQWNKSKADELGRMHGVAVPAPQPPVSAPAGSGPSAAFGSASLGGQTYSYNAQGTVSGLWAAEYNAGRNPGPLKLVAENGTARYFVFGSGRVAFTPADGQPARWFDLAA